MRLVAVITDPWSGYRTDSAEVGKIQRHLLKIGRAPTGLGPRALNRTSLQPPGHAHR
jgi:hypothetical protein